MLLLMLSTPSIAADISQRFDIIFIRGYIQHGDAEEFDKAFAEGARKIFLTSEGGSTMAAIALAKRIAESGLPVQVRGHCISVCPAILLPAARSFTVRSGAFLAFHAANEGFSIELLNTLKAVPVDDPRRTEAFNRLVRDLDEGLDRMFAEVDEIYRRAGVAPSLTSQLIELTGDHLGKVTIDPETGHFSPTKGAPSLCDWWVPDAAGLSAIGLPVPGYVLPERSKIFDALRTERVAWKPLPTIPAPYETRDCSGL